MKKILFLSTFFFVSIVFITKSTSTTYADCKSVIVSGQDCVKDYKGCPSGTVPKACTVQDTTGQGNNGPGCECVTPSSLQNTCQCDVINWKVIPGTDHCSADKPATCVDTNSDLCQCGAPSPSPTIGPLPPPCSNPDKNGNCTEIASGLGFPLPTDPAEFVKTIFGIVLSLAGGIAIILIIMSGYALMFSGGNPEKVQSSREQLMAAIIGLLFIIFSMSILQIIGVDILHIPGLIRTP